MQKEEILRASRNENQNKDLYEIDVIRRSQRVGGLIGLIVAFALMCIEAALGKGTNYGYFIIILSASSGLWIAKAAYLKKKHEIALAALWTAITVLETVMYIVNF
ncbi:MAG: DUF6442 family protein [Firmicutes bacterium]|nr:DUF6442 family protein [[Eubacterium] siraeum]MCM1488238.1 DUF6442 family protein [Bacillota bacterium]